MATAIVKSRDLNNLILEPKFLEDSIPVYGKIRLWIDTKPPKPTDTWIIVGDFTITDIASLKEVKTIDATAFDEKIKAILDRAGVNLKDYDGRKSFHMDIKVPKRMIDGYADSIT